MDIYSPNSLVAPPQLSQDHESSLGSFSNDPAPFSDPSQAVSAATGSAHEYIPLVYPSPLQQAALAVLQEFDDQVALAWLTGVRSFRSDENHWFQPGNLSSRQFDAISVLKDCPHGLVSRWLAFIRAGGAFNGPQRLPGSSHLGLEDASAALLHSSWQGSSNTSTSSADSFEALPSLHDSNTVPTTPSSSRSRETFFDLPSEPSIDEATQSFTTSHRHWCFICINPRVITTCDGWKRHMKEHEIRYRCMPRGPIECTADGAKCAFCGFRNPSQGHIDTHKAFPCANKSLDVRSYTRKPHLITHLKTQHVSCSADLADRWKDNIDKTHFSCGFCVSHFDSLIEQLNHIDISHYRLFQHIRDWDSNKVISGLLLQPGVVRSWRRILASHPGLIDSLFSWDLSVIKNLQFRLQMGSEPADTLAEVAFNESAYDSSPHDKAEMVDTVGLSRHAAVAIPQQSRMTTDSASATFNSSKSSTVDEGVVAPSALHVKQAGWSWAVPNNSISHRTQSTPQGDTYVSKEDTAKDMQHPYRYPSHTLMTSGGNRQIQPQPSFYASWTSLPPPSPTLSTTDSVMAGDYSQGSPVLNPTSTASLGSNQASYQNQHNVGKARARYVNGNSSSTSDRKIPSVLQTSGPFTSPYLVSQPRKQPLRSKLKDYYDINTEADIDLDMDFVQRLMREEDSTRSRRRSR